MSKPIEDRGVGTLFLFKKLIRENESIEIRKQAEIIDRKLHGLINSLRGR
jgi:hypothetical protein